MNKHEINFPLFVEVLDNWHEDALMDDQQRDLDAATLIADLGAAGISLVPNAALAALRSPASPVVGETTYNNGCIFPGCKNEAIHDGACSCYLLGVSDTEDAAASVSATPPPAEQEVKRAVRALDSLDGVIPFTEALGKGDVAEHETELDYLVREAARLAATPPPVGEETAFEEELIPRKLYLDACRHVSLQCNRANAAEEALSKLRAQPAAPSQSVASPASPAAEMVAELQEAAREVAQWAEELDEAQNTIQQLQAKYDAATTVAANAIKTNMAAASTAQQIMNIIQAGGESAAAYKGALESLIENLKLYTPPLPSPPHPEGAQSIQQEGNGHE